MRKIRSLAKTVACNSRAVHKQAFPLCGGKVINKGAGVKPLRLNYFNIIN
ncbi:MAG: hypothetical protein RL020_1057 [Pseudomonadota bacterium]|jgi:hypothetical protein